MAEHTAKFEDAKSRIWNVADLIRGDVNKSDFRKYVLPLMVVRRLDAVLESTRAQVVQTAQQVKQKYPHATDDYLDSQLFQITGYAFYNVNPTGFNQVLEEKEDANLVEGVHVYLSNFSPGVKQILEGYNIHNIVESLAKMGTLRLVWGEFADTDLHPKSISSKEMGTLFEDLLRRFSEMSHETSGEYYTPLDVIRLTVKALMWRDLDLITSPAPARSIYDPTAGTGGMLTVGAAVMCELNSKAHVRLCGQERNRETWAIAGSEMLLKEDTSRNPAGHAPQHSVALGNTLTDDAFAEKTFDYIVANPPYGVDWKGTRRQIEDEHRRLGFDGRFGPGLPRVSDGSMLFLLHALSKMKKVETDTTLGWSGGSRIGIVMSGSPLFSGGAGSGESEIRRWIIENDLLEGIIGLPDQMFYNTGIGTYIWVLTNRKTPEAAGTVRLVDARELGTKLRKSLGDKRYELTEETIDSIVELYWDSLEGPVDDPRVKVLNNAEFGYARITVERPLQRVWKATLGTLGFFLSDATREAIAGLEGSVWPSAAEAKKAIQAHAPGLDAKTVNLLVKEFGVHDPDVPPTVADGKGKKASAVAASGQATLFPTGDPTEQSDGDETDVRYIPDPELRDQENIPLPANYLMLETDEEKAEAVRRAAEAHLEAEIWPYVPDAWIDHDKTRIGYEVPFRKHFYVYTPPQPFAEIWAEIVELEKEIQGWQKEIQDRMDGFAG